ncbi:MAG: hypothetical protein AAGK01_06315 [Pseudomonadota bacterium]
MTKTVILGALAALAIAPAAIAQEQTRTKTFDGPNASGTQTTTIDREAGTLDRDRQVTNKNTGKTASSTLDRQRTDTGSIVSRSQTGPAGNTRSLEGERTRIENGSRFEGSVTGRGGNTYGVSGQRTRDGRGRSSASQRVTNSAGETVGARKRTTTRNRNGARRDVTRVRRPR